VLDVVQKQGFVLPKTTLCFTQNKGMFYSKLRYVLPKTKACFDQNKGMFFQHHGKD
jgi:hypothetical protein